MKPTKQVTFNSEQQLLHKVWLQAFQKGRWEHTFEDKGRAQRFRFALYNAVKPIRDERVINADLSQALNDCIVRAIGCLVVVERRTNDKDLRQIAEGLGLEATTMKPVMSDDEEIAASLRRAQELLGEAPLTGADKYYPRKKD